MAFVAVRCWFITLDACRALSAWVCFQLLVRRVRAREIDGVWQEREAARARRV